MNDAKTTQYLENHKQLHAQLTTRREHTERSKRNWQAIAVLVGFLRANANNPLRWSGLAVARLPASLCALTPTPSL
jgi:hypothetical protein